jgi:hypothetical protein
MRSLKGERGGIKVIKFNIKKIEVQLIISTPEPIGWFGVPPTAEGG